MSQFHDNVYQQIVPFIQTACIPQDGWQGEVNGWEYSGTANVIRVLVDSVGTDATGQYMPGLKLRWYEGGTAKYGYLGSATYGTATNLFLVPTPDYTLSGSAISSPAVSRVADPDGFPNWFNWTPTFGGFSFAPPAPICRFRINAHLCTVAVYMPTSGTSNATSFTLTAPITAATVTGGYWGALYWMAADNGVSLTTAGRVYIGAGGGTITLNKDAGTGAWTATGLKSADFMLQYEVKG